MRHRLPIVPRRPLISHLRLITRLPIPLHQYRSAIRPTLAIITTPRPMAHHLFLSHLTFSLSLVTFLLPRIRHRPLRRRIPMRPMISHPQAPRTLRLQVLAFLLILRVSNHPTRSILLAIRILPQAQLLPRRHFLQPHHKPPIPHIHRYPWVLTTQLTIRTPS